MAWVLMQVVSVSIPVLDLPQWFDKIALLVMVIGFPVVLWYNWAIEHRVRKRFRNSHARSLTQTSRTRRAYREISYISVCSLVSLLIAVVLIEQVFEAMDESQLATNRDAIRAELLSNAIAVMPFTYSGASNNANSVDIFQSEILNFLSQSPSIKVTSERVLSSIPEEASLDNIRELTGAKYILEGNISEDGTNIQITTTIVDSETGYQLWTNRTRTKSTNKLSQLETISKQVKNALTFLMPQTENAALKFTPTDDIKAYDFYVRAKTAFKAAFNVEQLKVAEGLFLQALSQDSKFEQAQMGLCQTYIEKYALSNASQSFNLAKQACEVSSDTNRLKADAQIALGRLYVNSGEYSQALTFFDNALASEPENSMGLTGKARALSRLDRPDEATELFLAAIKAEPGYWRNYEQYGIFLFNRGQYPQASLQFYKQSLLQPNSEEAFNNLGAAHYLNNDYQSAIDSWRSAAAIKPSANTFSNLGTSMFFAKQFDNAIIMYQQAVKRAPSDFLLHGNLADAMKYANNKQQDSLIAYQTALDLAIESDVINPNNATTKASIARYMSELNRCSQAQELVQVLEYEGVNDPYIHYDLALIANNCGSQTEVVVYLTEALNQGYPGNLLLDDHQFARYHTQIQRMLDTL
jgi:tetratricopeptide (TPR) repeat protein